MTALSPRLAEIVDALPLCVGQRVLEIGGAPGAAAREVARRVGADGYVLVLDRSTKGVVLTRRHVVDEIDAGVVGVRHCAVEDFALADDESPYDLAFAVRVGALDGRHPRTGARALARIAAALSADGRLLVDGGDPVREIDLSPYRTGLR